MEDSKPNELTKGRGPLELLCHMAMMQGEDKVKSEPMVEIQSSAPRCVESSQTNDLLKPLPALSSEPGSPSSSRCVVVSARAKGASKWAPPSFVPLKQSKKPSIVPQSPTLKVSTDQGSLHLPLLQAKLEENMIDAISSEKISSPQSRSNSHQCHKHLIREDRKSVV